MSQTSDISAGELASFVFYAIMVARSVAVISEIYSQLQGRQEQRKGSLNCSLKSHKFNLTQAMELPDGSLSLNFNNVSFSYPSRPQEKALDEISFKVGEGETVHCWAIWLWKNNNIRVNSKVL